MTVMIVVSQLHLFLLFYLFSLLNADPKLLGDFGFSKNMMLSGSSQRYIPAIISFLLFSYIYSPVDSLLSFLTHVLSRHNEFQADRYAATLGRGKQLQKALQIISKENRGMVWPDWLYSAWHHTHPPVLERIERLKQLTAKQQ
jgi:STE24 endopeptidase